MEFTEFKHGYSELRWNLTIENTCYDYMKIHGIFCMYEFTYKQKYIRQLHYGKTVFTIQSNPIFITAVLIEWYNHFCFMIIYSILYIQL